MDAAAVRVYNRQTLLQYREHPAARLPHHVLERLRALGLLRDRGLQASASPGPRVPGKRRRKRCERKQKRGKRAGVRASLKANLSWPTLPPIQLSRFSEF